MSYTTHNMHSTQSKNKKSDQGITRCNQTWKYIYKKGIHVHGIK